MVSTLLKVPGRTNRDFGTEIRLSLSSCLDTTMQMRLRLADWLTSVRHEISLLECGREMAGQGKSNLKKEIFQELGRFTFFNGR